MRRPMIAAALALAAGAVAAGAGGAVALDASSATGRDLAVRAADGDLGVLRGVTGNRRAGAAAVPSSEMSPTLGAGDIVLYDREAYRAAAPARGDVVVLRTRPEQAAVCGSTRERFARVVGVPGDLVTLDGFGVTVNGARLEIAGAGRPQVNRAFGPVPPGRVLVLGDNRRGSCDSASWRPPFVSVRAIRGRVEGIFHPIGRAALLRTDGGSDLLAPDPAGRARLDAYIAAGRGSGAVQVTLLAVGLCDVFEGLCEPGEARAFLVNEIRRQRGRLRTALATLPGDCAAVPLRRLEAALGKDGQAAARGRVSLLRLARRLEYHYTVGLSGMASCWRVSLTAQRELGLR